MSNSLAAFQKAAEPHDRQLLWLCIGLGLVVGLLVGSGRPFYLLLALSIPLALVLFLRDETLILLLLLGHFSLEWFVVQFNMPSRITWALEGFIAMLCLKVILRGNVREDMWSNSTTLWVLLVFLGFSLCTALFNSVDPMSTAFGFRRWFRYPLMCWALCRASVRPEFPQFALKVFLFLVLCQIPVCIAQRFFGGMAQLSTGDMVGGTLGAFSTHALGILCIVAICLLMGWYRETRQKKLLFLVPLFFIPPSLAEVKAFFILTPLIFLYLFKEDLVRNPRLAFQGALVIVTLMAGSMFVYNSIYTYREKDRFRVYEPRVRDSLQDLIFNPQKLLEYETRSTSIRTSQNSDRRKAVVGRLEMVSVAHEAIAKEWTSIIFGKGLGSYTKNSIQEEKRPESLIDEIGAKHLVGSAMIELGYGGLILLMILAWAVFRDSQRWRKRQQDPFWRGIAHGYQGIVLLMVFSSLYLGSFLYGEQTSFAFWFLAALVILAQRVSAQAPPRVSPVA